MSIDRLFCDVSGARVWGWRCIGLLLVVSALWSGSAMASGKEYWHSVRYEYISLDYVYDLHLNNQEVRLQDAYAPGASDPVPEYRLTRDSNSSGVRYNISFNVWEIFGLVANGVRSERGFRLEKLATSGGRIEGVEQTLSGTLTVDEFNYGFEFHTTGAVITYDAAFLYSSILYDYEVNGVNALLGNFSGAANSRVPDSRRTGLKISTGVRFRMGHRWETDIRYHQSFYNDAYNEQTIVEASVAWVPWPKTEFRLTLSYDVIDSILKNNFGLRLYF